MNPLLMCADGPSAAEVEKAARANGLALAPSLTADALRNADAPHPQQGVLVLLLAQVNAQRLCAALQGRFSGVIEAAPGDEGALTPSLRDGLHSGGIAVSVCSASAVEADLARALALGLAARGVGAAAGEEALDTALQEAVANAVTHGNLGLSDVSRGSPEDFMHFSEVFAERLADPELGRRRVRVAARWSPEVLQVIVEDEGPGFDPDTAVPPPSLTRPSGRGLQLVRDAADRVRFEDRGRRIVMEFAR